VGRDELHVEAAAAWPDFEVTPERFARCVAERGDVTHASDLYLVCACLDGDPVALATLDRQFFAQLPRLLHRQRADASVLDEVKQVIATKLLVGVNGEPPRLAQYGGRGPLLTWLKVVGSRALSNQRRGASNRDVAERASQPEAIAGVDPELALIRQRFGVDFREALVAAFGSLELRERNMLRLHFVDRLGIDALAPIFQVSRATAARHLAAARTTLTERTVTNLGARLKLAGDELDSLVRQVRSKLDLSLSAVLRV
jgi:RNA polymerase sigma-70 factor (ECF subfamily)